MSNTNISECKVNECKKAFIVFMDVMGYKSLEQEKFIELHQIICENIQELVEFKEGGRGKNEGYNLYVFSDNILLYLKTNQDINNFCQNKSDFIDFTEKVGTLYIKLLNSGFLIRGGITLNSLLENKFSVGGVGLMEAYLLESKLAQYPLIMINSKYLKEENKKCREDMFIEMESKIYLNPNYFITDKKTKNDIINNIKELIKKADEKNKIRIQTLLDILNSSIHSLHTSYLLTKDYKVEI